jgi:hypothetical protein
VERNYAFLLESGRNESKTAFDQANPKGQAPVYTCAHSPYDIFYTASTHTFLFVARLHFRELLDAHT